MICRLQQKTKNISNQESVTEENWWKGPFYKGFHTVKDNSRERYPI